MTRRVGIVGSRHYNPAQVIDDRMAAYEQRYGMFVVVSGGEPTGVDTCAKTIGEIRGHEVVEHLPKERTRVEFFARNTIVANDIDELWALFAPGLRSPGTSDTVRKAKARGIPVFIHHEGRWTRE